MITMTITMDARPEKRKELLQTFAGLLPLLEQESGYYDSRVYADRNNVNHLLLVEQWESRQDAERHMQSNYFTILRGAMQLLTTSSDITFAPVPQSTHTQPIFANQCQECGDTWLLVESRYVRRTGKESMQKSL